MSRVRRAMAGMLLLLMIHMGGVYLAATRFLPSSAVESKYQRIPKSEIQRSLIIVSDMTSHFARDVALKLADMGFFVLAGVRTESDRKAYTGYNTVKGLESFVLDIADPMDMVQMSYRVTQIEQKYNRSLFGLVLVDTFETNDVTIPTSQWVKQNKLRKKLIRTENDTTIISPQEKEELFHLNTNKKFDIYETHSSYQQLFQGPYRLIQACYDLASSSMSRSFRVTFLRPKVISPDKRRALFVEDLVDHSRDFLEARRGDETTLQRPSGVLHSSLSLVEYAHLPPFSSLEPLPKRGTGAKKRTKKPVRLQSRSEAPAPVSTTSTPSAISTEDVLQAVEHAIGAQRPLPRYHVGRLQLCWHKILSFMGGFDARATEESCSGFNGDALTCDGEGGRDMAAEAESLLSWLCGLLRRLLEMGNIIVRKGMYQFLTWCRVSTVAIPLSTLVHIGEYLLPPVVYEYLWKSIIAPCLVSIV